MGNSVPRDQLPYSVPERRDVVQSNNHGEVGINQNSDLTDDIPASTDPLQPNFRADDTLDPSPEEGGAQR